MGAMVGVGQRRAPVAAVKMVTKNLKKADLRSYLIGKNGHTTTKQKERNTERHNCTYV